MNAARATLLALALALAGCSDASGKPSCGAITDCPSGQVCVFSTSTCAPSCSTSDPDPCGTGLACVECATSSCPNCKSCLAACVPPPP